MIDSLISLIDQKKDVLSQVSAAILVFNGLIFFLAPQKARYLYFTNDLKLKDPKSWEVCDFVQQRFALCLITSPVTWWLHVEAGLSRDEAIGVVALPWILLCLHSLLNETCQRLGSSPKADYICLTVFSLVAFATLTHASYSNLSVKSLAGFTLANGLLSFMNPAAIGSLYGTPEREDFILLMRRSYGNGIISVAIFTAAFAWGVPQLKVVGLTWIVAGIGQVLLLEDLKKFKVVMAPILFWLFLAAFFGITLLI
jgi:uncharacterized protein YjeT (DUF2065 family)